MLSRRKLCAAAMVCFILAGLINLQLAAAGSSLVAWDAPAIVIAEPVNPAVVSVPTISGNLVRLQFTVSALVSSEFRGKIVEYVVEVTNPHQSMRVLDLWPRTQVYSEIEGHIAVEHRRQQDSNLAFTASGSFEPLARASANGDYRDYRDVQEKYARKPPVQMLTSSGTIDRGYGAFFKFRPGPLPIVEGNIEFAILVEVPTQWRSGMIHVSLRSSGYRSQETLGSRPIELGSARMWTAVHRLGDIEAAEQARRTVRHEQLVRSLAIKKQKQIDERSYPTIFHRVGAAIEIIDPRIPENYLTQILYGVEADFFNEKTNRLPVDLRVAALDYWDQRKRFLSL